MLYPRCLHTLIRQSANMAHLGSSNHACGPIPNQERTALSIPAESSLYIHVHTIEIATTGVTYGRKKAVRYVASPRMRWLSNPAMASARAMPVGTVPSTYLPVLASERMKSES